MNLTISTVIKQTAIRTLKMEAEALQNLTQYINADFERLVQAILTSSGRVVVTGIGKSAIIGQKIVATFNSTGTPALFMHAADAIHGDLGMIQANDIVICISKSGETPEVKTLIPLLKREQFKLVALVGNPNSYLAQNAEYVLLSTVKEEACPLNLAPTTSTVAQLGMGDALAVCILEQRGFSAKDFARFHPGGALGKRLYLKVEDLYQADQAPKVPRNASIRAVILEISAKRLGATIVVEADGSVAGIITDGDLRRAFQAYSDTKNITAEDIMTLQPKCLQKGALAITALELIQEYQISQVVILSGHKYEGIVHVHDLVREGIL